MLYKIACMPNDATAIAAIQAVPVSWSPYVGADAYGDGTPTAWIGGRHPTPDPDAPIFWGIPAEFCYDSATMTGYDDGTTWNEARAAATWQGITGATVTTE